LAASSVRVICGPTAAGKSAIAMRLCERYGPATIVSADSRQIYRGFDVGTAKPSAEERRRVPHEGIDVVEPTVRYSASAWAADAERWIGSAERAARTPVVVGGTGFYLRALFEPLFDAPVMDEGRRSALERVLGGLTVPELRRWCTALDPPRAHLGRTQLLRSIETALLTGERLSDLHRTRARPARLAARYLVVDPGPVLARRIAGRVEAMLDAGWVEEVRRLAPTVPADAPAWNSTGYHTVRRLAAGEIDRRSAAELVTVETRQYAKRQRTWFRHQLGGPEVTRVDPDDPRCDLAIAYWWNREEGA
jgi:tRNA dimethylallyltransferase